MSLFESFADLLREYDLKRTVRTVNDIWETIYADWPIETIEGVLLPLSAKVLERIKDDVHIGKSTAWLRTGNDYALREDDKIIDNGKTYLVRKSQIKYDPDTGIIDHFFYYLVAHE